MSHFKKTKVWVNGCFDILHEGHLDLLEFASCFGELHIGIDCDLRVRKMKGVGRPINTQGFRKKILESFRFVKSVYVFETDQELRNRIKKVSPDFMVIGDDYKVKNIIGAEYIKNIIFFNKTSHSTTNIIKKIKDA